MPWLEGNSFPRFLCIDLNRSLMYSPHADQASRARGGGVRVSFPRWLRKTAVYLLTVLSVTCATVFAGVGQASADGYNCPTDRICHFVRIDQTKTMRWNASMRMYNSKTGETYYQWSEKHGLDGSSPKGGSYVLWYWQVAPGDTTVKVDLTIDFIQNFTREVPVTYYVKGVGWVTGYQEETYTVQEQANPSLDPLKDHNYTLDPDRGLSGS